MNDLAAVEASVSRETLVDLKEYVAAIHKWNAAINLFATSTLGTVWERHILDGLQLWPLLVPFKKIVDFGSGGGIPGIPIAVAAKHADTSRKITLVESDGRKAAFLTTLCHQLRLPATVLVARIENVPPQKADVCVARALAPTDKLLHYAERHLRPDGVCFFLKGKRAQDEISKARETWNFSLIEHQSKTDPNAKILEVGDLRRA